MYFIIPFIVVIVVQLIKLMIDVYNDHTITRSHLFSSGGFPSVHSAMSVSVVVLAGVIEGTNSILFTVSMTFAFLLRYDAVNVRMEAGKHAMQINVLNDQLEKQGPTKNIKNRKLKERIGHTPIEVLGGIVVGTLLTFALLQLPYFSM